jgi:hypothetical protein
MDTLDLTPSPALVDTKYILTHSAVTISYAFTLNSTDCIDADVQYEFDFRANRASFDTSRFISVDHQTKQMTWHSAENLNSTEITVMISAFVATNYGDRGTSASFII